MKNTFCRYFLTFLSILILMFSGCALLKKPAPALSPQKVIVVAVQEDIKNPESVLYHYPTQSFYVSNIDGDGNVKDGNGYISHISKNGTVITAQWIKGLNAPKGMRIYKNTLWVTDIDKVYAFNLSTGNKITEIEIKEAIFLNDIAIDKKGIVYVSDTLASTIYRIENGAAKVFMEGKNLESPNGLLVIGQYLYVAAWGYANDWETKTSGMLYKINLKTSVISNLTDKIGNLDGLERDNQGNFYVSDWVAGKIYKISSDGKNIELIHQTVKGSADIGIIPEENILLIPEMIENRVIGIRL